MSRAGVGVLRGAVAIKADDPRFFRLLADSLIRPPPDVPHISSVRTIVLSRRATGTTVGLTRYSLITRSAGARPRQTLTFYSELFNRLSDAAAEGVIAHELAHAWLNEHVSPEDSADREKAADRLAREWGFGNELDALENEAETVGLGERG